VSGLAAVVIPGAGEGRRFGGVRKPFVELAGRPLLAHTLEPFLAVSAVRSVVIALAAEDADSPPAWLAERDERIAIVAGGEERGDSVLRALERVPDSCDVVLVHDAARPLLTRALVERCIAAAAAGRSVVAAVPVIDTIQQVDEHGAIVATPDRRRLRHAQTPQAFPRAVLIDAYRRAAAQGVRATDDAALVACFGGAVATVDGEAENLKVTTPVDLALAELLLSRRAAAADAQQGSAP
jgi:2-C-methyl-D-erythritol 4-phosphate cytidylyltransferase